MTVSPASIARQIRDQLSDLALAVVQRQYAQQPHLHERYGTRGRDRCLQDAAFHLQSLASALEYARPSLFMDYVAWAKCLLVQRGLPEQDIEVNLRCIADALRDALPAGSEAVLRDYVEAAVSRMLAFPQECESFLDPSSPLADLRQQYLRLLLAGRRHDASQAVIAAVDGGLSIEDSYLRVFQPVQYEIGRLWQMNRITVAQEHYCTAVTQLVMSQLYPRLFASPRAGRRAVVASVGGDLHEIGGRMVADLLELNGWDTTYLGASTPLDGITQMVAEREADLVAISVTMTYHLPKMRDTISALRARPDCAGARILIGGRPLTLEPELWREMGADAWAPDAREAVAIASDLTRRPR